MKVIRVTETLHAREGIEYEIDSGIYPGETEQDMLRAMRLVLEANFLSNEDDKDDKLRIDKLLDSGDFEEDKNNYLQPLTRVPGTKVLTVQIPDYDGGGNGVIIAAAVIELDPRTLLDGMRRLIEESGHEEIEIIRMANRLGGLFRREKD